MNTTYKIILAIIFVIAVSGGYWFVYLRQAASVENTVTPNASADSAAPAAHAQPSAQAIQFDKYFSSAPLTPATPAAAAPTAVVAPSAPAPASVASEKKISSATFHTSMGDMEIIFNPATPNTVANFLKLASSGFYDGTKFHRVIKGFMSQGGDPFSKDDSKANLWGTGGPGYAFADELTANNSNDTYTIAMANSGPNTNGSQFFINAAPNHFLDTKHVVFARVVKGQAVADAINAVATGAGDRPQTPVVITSISLQ